MAVKRIVANLASEHPSEAATFYRDILGLEIVMDHGWILTFAGPETEGRPQLSIASEGGSGTPVPDLSIEVDDFDDVLDRVQAAGLTAEYGPVVEPWGVRRLYLRDPLGHLVNILTHKAD